jgi:hypothetical protein
MIDEYLNYLQEVKIPNWLKQMGVTVKDLYFENSDCKQMRNNKSYIFLFHGTRPEYVNSIKKKGLLISMAGKRSKEDKDITLSGGKQVIWFTSKNNPTSPEFGGKKKSIIVLTAKLNVKFLKNFMGSTYTYEKNIPPKDIIWEDDNRFKKIIKSSKCLKEIK